jgi:hypothetical protein
MENNTESKTCFICWEEIKSTSWVQCVRCDILLHCDCNNVYNNRNYCKCPHCQRIGTLGSFHDDP